MLSLYYFLNNVDKCEIVHEICKILVWDGVSPYVEENVVVTMWSAALLHDMHNINTQQGYYICRLNQHGVNRCFLPLDKGAWSNFCDIFQMLWDFSIKIILRFFTLLIKFNLSMFCMVNLCETVPSRLTNNYVYTVRYVQWQNNCFLQYGPIPLKLKLYKIETFGKQKKMDRAPLI